MESLSIGGAGQKCATRGKGKTVDLCGSFKTSPELIELGAVQTGKYPGTHNLININNL